MDFFDAFATLPSTTAAANIMIPEKESVPSISKLRKGLDPFQQQLLQETWKSYRDTGQWPELRDLYVDHGDKQKVKTALSDLKAIVGQRTQDGHRYSLSLLGVLLTEEGTKMEKLLEHYFQFQRHFCRSKRKEPYFPAEEVAQMFQLNNDEIALLGTLLEIGGHHPAKTANNWQGYRMPAAEDFFHKDGELFAEVEKWVFQYYHHHVNRPVFEEDHRVGRSEFAIAEHERQMENFGFVSAPKNIGNQGGRLIFISHSHADKDLAEALVDLLCAALHLRRSEFVCTSVDGSRLRGGDDPGEVLRDRIREVPVFLSLLTPQSLNSNYVLFELGARWGCDGHHIPLLAKGSGTDVLKPPLKQIGLLLNEENDVRRLIEDVGHVLTREVQPTSSYNSKLLQVVKTATKKPSRNPFSDR